MRKWPRAKGRALLGPFCIGIRPRRGVTGPGGKVATRAGAPYRTGIASAYAVTAAGLALHGDGSHVVSPGGDGCENRLGCSDWLGYRFLDVSESIELTWLPPAFVLVADDGALRPLEEGFRFQLPLSQTWRLLDLQDCVSDLDSVITIGGILEKRIDEGEFDFELFNALVIAYGRGFQSGRSRAPSNTRANLRPYVGRLSEEQRQRHDAIIDIRNRRVAHSVDSGQAVVTVSFGRDGVYELLIFRGVRPHEIFYTSRPNDVEGYKDLSPLQQQIRERIKSKNTLLFYFTSDSFLSSQYCMFEGGAGWITRSVGEFRLLSVRFEDVPHFLTNGKKEFSLLDGSKIELRPDVHQYLIDMVLNPMINHLNQGRAISSQEMIKPFDSPVLPTKVQLKASGGDFADYFDQNLVDHWEAHVTPIAADYVRAMESRDAKRRASRG